MEVGAVMEPVICPSCGYGIDLSESVQAGYDREDHLVIWHTWCRAPDNLRSII